MTKVYGKTHTTPLFSDICSNNYAEVSEVPEITQASMPIDVLEGRLLKQLEDMEYTQSTIRNFSVLVKSIK